MKIVINSPVQGSAYWVKAFEDIGLQVALVKSAHEFADHPDAFLLIDAAYNGYFAKMEVPLLFHAPAYTFEQLPDAPAKSARICAWPQFWERTLWEMAVKPVSNTDWVPEAMKSAGLEYKLVPDIAGLIGPRILCTIINEAVYTLSAGIANAKDIDTAMKLGTNYPLGPVEWAQQIGLPGIREVLNAMADGSPHYYPHPDFEILNRLYDPHSAH